MDCPTLIGREFVVTDYYQGPMSGVADSPRDFLSCDIAGRSGFFGELLSSAYSKIEALEVGNQAVFISNAVAGYKFAVTRFK